MINSKGISIYAKNWLYVSITVCLSSIFGLLFTGTIIKVENQKLHTFSLPSEIGIEKTEDDVTVMFEIPVRSDGVKNCWQSDEWWGSQYDIYLNNNSKAVIKNWNIKMTVPDGARIDSSWNGTYSHDGNVISITRLSDVMNESIQPGSNIKVGFVLYTLSLLEKSLFVVECNFVTAYTDSPVFKTFEILLIFSLLGVVICILLYVLLKKQDEMSDQKINELMRLCASFIDTRDEYTRMHSSHVAAYSKYLAKELGYDSAFQKKIFSLGMLHDLGKVMISRDILCKPGKLDNEEWSEMKRHTTYGADIVKDFDLIEGVREAALFHHERYDGKGYMAGLSGEDIPLEARIICVADSFDAMATDRAYRPKLSKEVIVEELKKGKGSQFDPKIADAMIHLIENGEIKC